jgi:hypothetical protein
MFFTAEEWAEIQRDEKWERLLESMDEARQEELNNRPDDVDPDLPYFNRLFQE